MQESLLLSLTLLFCLGCGDGGPFEYVEVAGLVSYEDGSTIPTAGMQLKFIALGAPNVGGARARPAIAHVDNNGRFECATSYKYCDGLIPGTHKVAILNAKDTDGKLLIPADYASTATSPLVIDTSFLPLEIKVPKP